jgi:tetratricopeptide (TPR) repeat protein
MAQRHTHSTELLLTAVAGAMLAITGAAWHAATFDSIASLQQRSALSSADASLRAQLVQKLVDAGRADQAIEVLRRRVATDAGDGLARRSLVDLLAARGRAGDAADVLRRQLEQHADDAASRERLADLQVAMGEGDQAETLYKQVLAQWPENVAASYGLARAYVIKKDGLQAQRTLEESLKKHPNDPATNALLADLAIQSLGEIAYPAAQKYYERAVAGDPARADAALGLARIYISQGRLADAAGVLARPAAADRKNAPLHLCYADVLAGLKRTGAAGVEYSTATAYDRGNAEAYYRWGEMLIDSGSPASAVERILPSAIAIIEPQLADARRTSADSPLTRQLKRRCAEFHLEMARGLRDLSDLGAAADCMPEFEKALDCDPSDVDVYLEVARTQRALRHEGTAEKWLKDAMVVAPASVEAKVDLAKLYMNATDPAKRNRDAAIALLAESVSLTQSKDISLLVGLARALASAKRYDEALEQMNVAMTAAQRAKLNPGQMELLASLRQEYFLAMIPQQTGPTAMFGIDGRVVHDPADDPLPPPWQPSILELGRHPIDLTKPPARGNALDPALYRNDAVEKPKTGEFNGMPILDMLK